MSTVEELSATQEQLSTAIEQLFTNFKKDGADRKTPDAIKRRLETLDTYWRDYQENHIKLCGFGIKSDEYFTSNQYETTAKRFNSIRATIQNYQPCVESRPSTPILKPATPLAFPSIQQPMELGSTSSHRGVNSKTDEMLRKQSSNFKAFEHTVTNIKLDTMTERWEFEHSLRAIQVRWSAIDSLHWELDSELGGRNSDYEAMFYSYEKTYNEATKSINRKLWSVSHREQSTPHMEIPTFSGSYSQWSSFKDLFMETIHNNPTLSSAQKMQFLKSKMKGEAERLIQHLPISSSNYSICWDILTHRYNNKKLILNSHIDLMLNIPVTQQASINHIKKIHDITRESLNAIKNLGVEVASWDPLLIHLLCQKLDTETHNEYVASLKHPREIPKLQDFLSFMESKFTTMESSRRKQEPINKSTRPYNQTYQLFSNPKYHNPNNNSNIRPSFPAHSRVISQSDTKKNVYMTNFYKCPICKTNDHAVFYCPEFRKMTPTSKRYAAKKQNLCQNCLYCHNGKACFSEKRCRECNQSHNTLLHEAFMQPDHPSAASTSRSAAGTASKPEPVHAVRSNSHVSLQRDIPEILLATAMVHVKRSDGSQIKLRALLDQGSQTSIITENAAQLLGLPRQKCQGVISGVGATQSNCKGLLHIKCSAVYTKFEFETNVLIMKNLINHLPSHSFAKPEWSYLDNIILADQDFNISRPIDLLFGADIYSLILLEGISRANNHAPIAQNTRLGWILSGNVKTLQCNVVLNNLDDIKQFWEMEDIINEPTTSSKDQECIQFYQDTTIRRDDGRYEVKLPLKPDFKDNLGLSKHRAVAQFKTLERKFMPKESIKNNYQSFMNEYEILGHMKPVTENPKSECFLTHHSVDRAEPTSTKFRVVFNASAKTSSGYSLNDVMETGPNLQQDLQSLIIKWRQYQFAITADIEKMFRQIWVNEQDQKYQKIVWRNSTNEPLRDYQLATVTYGTKAAPFLAMMTLKQLASDERINFKNSQATDVLEQSFYMDDLVHGSHSINSAKQLYHDLIKLLKSGGFNLRKWRSNIPELSSTCNNSDCHQDIFNFKQAENTKTLGLSWDPQSDIFMFNSKIEQSSSHETKRSLLSNISKLFDPLGWLSPLSTKLKIIFQKVWLSNIKWDDPLPEEINTEWMKIKSDIKNINNLEIKRWLGIKEGDVIELHGFCDSSIKAYACVIYCKIKRQEELILSLLVGKARLVPASTKVTLPKLELSGALLLSKLMAKIKTCFNNYELKIYGWSDSMIVLGWLNGDPARWKTFVSNRVKEITSIIPPQSWHYIKSDENPADCASRGLTASQLLDHSLWWQGPSWLLNYNDQNNQTILYSTEQEMKSIKQINVVTQQELNNNIIYQLLLKHSSFNKITRILSWALRFTRKRTDRKCFLTLSELNRSKNMIIKQIQRIEFINEISNLEKGLKLHTRSKLYELNPFLDENSILRVGGRLKNANINLETKHPIIIPGDCRLAELLIDQSHKLVFHGGARLTSSFLRQKFWLIGGNRAVKKRLRNCVKCRRHDPVNHSQIMGDLPIARVSLTRPFHHTGVDFTGFVDVKSSKGRGIKISKGYIAVFVCMVTKAVHLELVSDLSSSAFLAALRRMAARRGTPYHIYSDNGTNFTGASRVLKQEFINLQATLDDDFFANITDMNIQWHFIAPSWPSAGGLWEAAVKSLKYHLKRVIGEQKLTFEEYSTLLCQLEGCLNSRPLTALTEDVEDLNYLTPSHFLASGPTLNIIETEKDLRTRWQLTQKIFDDIWKRWKTEYLCQLQTRCKWRQSQDNLKIDDIVIIKDINLPAGKWPLGRIITLHPGSDGYVRVVTLKTKNGLIKRPITKISRLPISNQAISPLQEDNKNQNVYYNTYHVLKTSLLFLLFMCLIVAPAHCKHTISRLNISQGFYFDEIGDMRLERDQWKLVIYYDMAPYWQGTELLNKYVNHLDNICYKTNEETIAQCDVILLQLHHGLSELEHYNGILLGQQLSRRDRTATLRLRRGLVDGIGYIANSLFGILDEHFAEQYEKDIDNLRANQKHLALLWKNQTSIVEAEFNLIKRIENTMNKQHKNFNLHLNKLDQAINMQQNKLQHIATSNDFTLSSVIANNVLSNLRTIQEMLIDSITDIYLGKFNLHVLTPDQLTSELNVITGLLSKDLTLPLSNIQQNLSRIYHLLTVKARASKRFIIFEVSIPLVSRDNFEIYKLIPIPQQIDKNMISLIPVSDHVAVNLQRDSYLPISERYIQDCIIYESDTRLCRLKQPVHQFRSDENFCVKNEKSDQCKTLTSTCSNSWTELHMINSYLFFCCDQCTVRIMCGENQVTSQLISKAGIITLSSECLIKGNTFTIYSHKKQSNVLHKEAEVIQIDIPPINKIINLSIPISYQASTDNYQDIKEIQNRIDQMKANQPEETLVDRVSYHDIHHYTIIYILVGASVVAGVLYCCRRVRQRRRSARLQPAPAGLEPRVLFISDSESVQCQVNNKCASDNNIQCVKSNQCASETSTRVLDKSTSPIVHHKL